MFARVSTTPHTLNRTQQEPLRGPRRAETYRYAHGYVRNLVLVDSAHDKVVEITLWETREDLVAGAPANDAGAALPHVAVSDGPPPDVQIFEVASPIATADHPALTADEALMLNSGAESPASGLATGAVAEDAPTHKRDRWPARLTEREVDVLRMLARGLNNRDIATELFITKKTVAHHLEHVYDKIGVSSRTEAVLWAQKNLNPRRRRAPRRDQVIQREMGKITDVL